jgi:hypothetical protein
MLDIQDQLIELSDNLDAKKLYHCANAVDGLLQAHSLQKVAQYVGVIGYVLKQNRAMSNCIRKKRASSSGSMQEVVLSCLKEYQDGQQYDNNEWTGKYAQVIQHTPDNFDDLHLTMLSGIAKESNIEDHLSQLEKTAKILNKHNIKNTVVHTVLSHVDILGGILAKEVRDETRPSPF